MIRKILGAVAGYAVFFIFLFLFFLALYLALGADRSFLPGKYDPSITWTISTFILGFIASVIGGFVAALIGKSGSVKIMVGLMIVIGAMSVVMLLVKNKPEEVRVGSVPMSDVMDKAREPVWSRS